MSESRASWRRVTVALVAALVLAGFASWGSPMTLAMAAWMFALAIMPWDGDR